MDAEHCSIPYDMGYWLPSLPLTNTELEVPILVCYLRIAGLQEQERCYCRSITSAWICPTLPGFGTSYKLHTHARGASKTESACIVKLYLGGIVDALNSFRGTIAIPHYFSCSRCAVVTPVSNKCLWPGWLDSLFTRAAIQVRVVEHRRTNILVTASGV